MARKDAVPGQRYACDRPGCDKHYSRPDHLLRHKLNHDREKVLACNQCDRTFVRQDLLARHLERHALRGKTLGRWSGKQKSSTDSMGGEDQDEDLSEDDAGIEASPSGRGENVPMRPSRTSLPHLQASQQHTRADPAELLPTLDQYDTPFAYNAGPALSVPAGTKLPPHPFGYRDATTGHPGGQEHDGGMGIVQHHYGGPSSASSSSIGPPIPYDAVEHHIPTSTRGEGHRHQQHTQQYPPYPRSSFSRGGQSGSSRSVWDLHQQSVSHAQQQQQQEQFGGAPPVSGSVGPLYAAPTGRSASVIAGTGPQGWHGVGAYIQAPTDEVSSFAVLPAAMAVATIPDTTALLHSAVSGSSHFPFSAPTASDYIADYDWLFDGSNPLVPSTSGEEMGSAPSETSTTRETQATDDTHARLLEGGDGDDGDAHSDDMHRSALTSDHADALRDLAFFAILQRDIPDEPAFDVDTHTHSRLLHFLSSVQELATSPLFTPSALQCYLYLFFTKLNAIYPLIHRPTFSAKTADPMLLSAMIVCGAHFADEAAHLLAERIGRKLWGAFISFEDFRPARATLALLQAMLLTETFGKMMGTRPQHETAHLFHNFIVTLAWRNAVFVPSKVMLPHAPEERWRAWSREEEKKRISFYAFVLDAQHATIFRHIPALSAFQIHLQLPCDEDEWEARSAAEWATLRQGKRSEPPYFIAALKASLSPDHAPPIASTDSFKHFVLLHGLMSVAYDLQWKQQALLAAPDTSDCISSWKDRLLVSYRACMQRCQAMRVNAASMITTSSSSRRQPALPVERASHSLIEWAQIVLYVDPVDIQIYAGLPTVMGRFIDHHTFSVARKSCREWARSENARIAVWRAARFLQSTLLPEGSSSGNSAAGTPAVDGEAPPQQQPQRPLHTGFDELLHHQWVQYLCALVIWAYEQAVSPLRAPPGGSRSRSQDQESNASSAGAVAGLTSLQQAAAHSLTAQPVPSVATPLDRTMREAGAYLADVLASDTRYDAAFAPTHVASTAVLELVERECRGSRWELGREAGGVLRKLIRERNATAAAAVAAVGAVANGIKGTPEPSPGREQASKREQCL